MSLDSGLLTLLGSLFASAFALVRLSLAQHRALADRFVTFLEAALSRQEEANASLRSALQDLADGVRENSRLLERILAR